MDEINESGEHLVITKNGKPVSILMPYYEKPSSLFGLHRGQVTSTDDIISPIDGTWEADAAD